MKNLIKKKLEQNISCDFIEIINESYLHKGHHHIENGKEIVFDGTEESHFRIKIAAKEFKNLKKVAIHRKIYQILAKEMQKIHALAIEIL